MKTYKFLLIAALLFVSQSAFAGTRVNVGIGVGFGWPVGPCYTPVYSPCYQPVYYPCGGYYPPQPVYIQPAPQIIYQPAPAPQTVYIAPQPAPQVQVAPVRELTSYEKAFKLGKNWGQDVRNEVTSLQDFASFLKNYSFVDGDGLEQGFIEGYGQNGKAAFKKASGR